MSFANRTENGTVHPIVHLNGTSKDELANLRLEASHRIRSALRALRLAGPNERDYYVEPGSFTVAKEQHAARVKALTHIMDGLDDEVAAILDQDG